MTYEEIIVRQNRHWRGEKFPEGIERDIRSNVARFLDTKYVLVITGVRRSGKSYLLFQLIDVLLNPNSASFTYHPDLSQVFR